MLTRKTTDAVARALALSGYMGAERHALLSSIDARLIASLPILARPYDQALSDLAELGRIALAPPPLLALLEQASLRAADPTVFDAAIAELGGKAPAAPAASAVPDVPPSAADERTLIMFLAASADGDQRLRIGREHTGIIRRLRSTTHRDRFELKAHLALRPTDIIQLLDAKPQLLHFSGHGTEDGLLRVENDAGRPHTLSKRALHKLFRRANHAGQLRCVLINACWSAKLAEALVSEGIVPAAIGCQEPLADRAAIDFSAPFYARLADGKSISDAFEDALLELDFLGHEEAVDTLRLFLAPEPAPSS